MAKPKTIPNVTLTKVDISKKLDPAFWTNIPVGSKKGINPLIHLQAYLSKLFPGFEFGFFSKDDLEDRRSQDGYVLITTEHWNAVEEWNEHVAERYALSDKNGALCWKNLFVCARPITFGDSQRNATHEESERRYRAAKTGTPFRIQERSAVGISVGAVSKDTASEVDPEKFTETDLDEGEEVYSSRAS